MLCGVAAGIRRPRVVVISVGSVDLVRSAAVRRAKAMTVKCAIGPCGLSGRPRDTVMSLWILVAQQLLFQLLPTFGVEANLVVSDLQDLLVLQGELAWSQVNMQQNTRTD